MAAESQSRHHADPCKRPSIFFICRPVFLFKDADADDIDGVMTRDMSQMFLNNSY